MSLCVCSSQVWHDGVFEACSNRETACALPLAQKYSQLPLTSTMDHIEVRFPAKIGIGHYLSCQKHLQRYMYAIGLHAPGTYYMNREQDGKGQHRGSVGQCMRRRNDAVSTGNRGGSITFSKGRGQNSEVVGHPPPPTQRHMQYCTPLPCTYTWY